MIRMNLKGSLDHPCMETGSREVFQLVRDTALAKQWLPILRISQEPVCEPRHCHRLRNIVTAKTQRIYIYLGRTGRHRRTGFRFSGNTYIRSAFTMQSPDLGAGVSGSSSHSYAQKDKF